MTAFAWDHVYTDSDPWAGPATTEPFARAMSERCRALGWMHLADNPAGVPALSAPLEAASDFTHSQGPDDVTVDWPRYFAPSEFTDYPRNLARPATVDSVSGSTLDYTLDDGSGSGTATIVATWTDAAPADACIIRDGRAYPADYAGDAWNWQTLIAMAEAMRPKWIDPDEDIPEGQDNGFTLKTLADRENWPNPAGGWTRKREREISSLADSGSAGQRARYIWTTSSPSGQRGLGALVMEHDGTEWAAAADQSDPPDILTSYGVPQPGDLFGSHILNDLVAAINSMVWTAPDFYAGNLLADVENQGSSIETDADLATARAAAEASWPDSYTTTTDVAAEFITGETRAAQALVGGIEWTVSLEANRYTPKVARLSTHCAKAVDFYPIGLNPTGSGTVTFDGQGVFAAAEIYPAADTAGPSGSAVVTGSPFGLAATTKPAWPAQTTDSEVAGYGVAAITWLAIIRWNVAGGFDYTL